VFEDVLAAEGVWTRLSANDTEALPPQGTLERCLEETTIASKSRASLLADDLPTVLRRKICAARYQIRPKRVRLCRPRFAIFPLD
jgi:hypothetical protein